MASAHFVHHHGGSDAHFQVERRGTTATLHVTGFLTSSSTPRLRELLNWQIHDGAVVVIVDFAVSTGVDSDCLLLLRAMRRRLQERGGELSVRSARRDVINELRLVGLDGARSHIDGSTFGVCDSVPRPGSSHRNGEESGRAPVSRNGS